MLSNNSSLHFIINFVILFDKNDIIFTGQQTEKSLNFVMSRSRTLIIYDYI